MSLDNFAIIESTLRRRAVCQCVLHQRSKVESLSCSMRLAWST